MSISLLPRVTGSLVPKGGQSAPFWAAGVGPYLTQPVNGSYRPAAQASCPTCNLIEIPYNPSLPVLNVQ